ncbi:DUF2336 domain-containing protein [Arenibaculum pallidiluteum]|uniref:DUF2336 domain-containing protein n=1 Tax=Arenibaculum pallidiluteum TaxID=2812559 RepID=UPI001A97126F|nr:DUF2336 domain-containing protein [Arenibaculum pallidiluteum]
MRANTQESPLAAVAAMAAGAIEPDLARLVEKARDRSPDARREVATTVGDLYMGPAASLTETERAIVLDILGLVIRDAERTVRVTLAARLAEDSAVPRALALQLAGDEIEIARPVLLHSDLLGDDDLIDLVRRHATPHQLAIAARRVVSPPVGDALVGTGDAAVAAVLVRNAGARLSPGAVSILAEAAQRSADLGEPLLQRPELTPELAARLYWFVSVEFRRSLLRRFPIPADQLDRALQGTVQRLIDSSRRGLGPEHVMLADRLHAAGSIDAAVLIQVLRVGRFELFAMLFGRLAGLPPQTIAQTISDPGGEGLALACRALEIDKGHFASIFLMARGARRGEQVVDPRELTRVLSFFDRVPVERAKAVLAAWRDNPSQRPFGRRSEGA